MQTSTTEPLEIEIAEAPREAFAYVISTWGRIVEHRLEATPRPGFLHEFARIQAHLIKRSRVLLAEHGGRIVGFVVYEPRGETSRGVLHFICTREKHRQRGIGSRLLDAAGLLMTTLPGPEISFWTSDLRHLGLAEAPYTPFWLRY